MTKALSAPQEGIWKLLNHLKKGTTEEFDQVVAVQPRIHRSGDCSA